MDGKVLARISAAVFVGLAVAMTLVQLREPPAVRPEPSQHVRVPDGDPLPTQLKACADMGELALYTSDCRAAWTEKRRRFFGVHHPDAYSGLEDRTPSLPAVHPMPSSIGEHRGGS